MKIPDDIILKDFFENLDKAQREGNRYVPQTETVAALASRYPYFILPLALKLSDNDLPEAIRKEIALKVALLSADKNTIFKMSDSLADEFKDFYPPEESSEKEITTDEAIDTFLANYGNNDAKENAILEKLIFNPVPDYSQILLKEQEQALTEDSTQKDNKSQTNHKQISNVQHKDSQAQTQPNPDSLLSESLAKIYIKQQRFDKAFEIINNLNLNFPEKSRYFADQLRFIKKLMYIKEHK